MALAVRSGRPPHVLRHEWSSREFQMLTVYDRHCPIDDQANHHMPIASLQATVSNLMGGDRKLTDYLLYVDRDSLEDQAIDRMLAGEGW